MTRILYIQYTNPGGYPPLEHSSSILSEAGAEVVVLGTTAAGTKQMTWPDRPGVQVEIMAKRESGIRHKVDYLRYVIRVLRYLTRQRPQWLYVSDALVAPIGLLARRLTNVRIVYHEHDEPYAVTPSRLTRAILRMRDRLIRVADEVVVPNAARGERLRRQSHRTDAIRIVWNCPRRSEVRSNVAPDDGPLRLIYQGSISRMRTPLTLVDVLARVPDVELIVVGYETAGSVGHLDEMRQAAIRKGVADRLRIMGSISRSRVLDTTASCHVGLSFMPVETDNPNETTMVGSSNKAFEYLSCGLPLIVSDLPEWRDTFVSAGLARACKPYVVESLEAEVRWFASHRPEMKAMGRAGLKRVESDWNYDSQFAPLARVILNEDESAGPATTPQPPRNVERRHQRP